MHELKGSYFDAELLFSQLFLGTQLGELGFDPDGGRFEERAGTDPTINVTRQRYGERELAEAPAKVDNPHDYLYLIDPTRRKPASALATPSRRSQSAYGKPRRPSHQPARLRSPDSSQLGGPPSQGRQRLHQVDSESESFSDQESLEGSPHPGGWQGRKRVRASAFANKVNFEFDNGEEQALYFEVADVLGKMIECQDRGFLLDERKQREAVAEVFKTSCSLAKWLRRDHEYGGHCEQGRSPVRTEVRLFD